MTSPLLEGLPEGPAHGTPQWYAARRSGIGSSESAPVLGVLDEMPDDLDPYATPADVWARKVHGLTEAETEAMRWGTRLEGVVLAAAAEELGRTVTPWQRMIHDPIAPHLFATADGLASDETIVEAKVTSSQPWDRSGPPLRHQLQVQVQLAVTGLERAVIAALHRGTAFRLYPVERDDRVIDAIRDATERFWREHVEPRVCPRDANGCIPRRLLVLLHPADNGETVELPAEAEGWDDRLREIGKSMALLDVERETLRARLMDAIGDATWGRLSTGGMWQWRTASVRGYEVAPREERKLLRLKSRR